MKIDYIGHSGFFVETDNVFLLFDYYKGDLSFLKNISNDKPLYVFVSHAHSDHFNPAIFSIVNNHSNTKYLLSFDIKGNSSIPKELDIEYLDADKTYTIEGLGIVETLFSTDEGIAVLVKTPDKTIFHAGDLHYWDWPEEDKEWLNEQERVFKQEIMKLAGTKVDIAFVVLDSRLEENYKKGLEFILDNLHPQYVLPMHFWDDRNIVNRFKSQNDLNDSVLLDTTKETHWEIV